MKKNTTRDFLLFAVLPLLAVLAYPPQTLISGLGVILFAIAMFGVLAFFLFKGYSRALTLAIFLQGMNVLVRIMMLFPNSVSRAGVFDLMYLVMNIFGIALSTYLLLRLDMPDIRSRLVD